MTRRRFKLSVLTLAGLLAAQCSLRAAAADVLLAKSAVLESNVAYLQVVRVETNLADEIRAAQEALAVSNKIAGTVLDLRFAGGGDLATAKATADLFAARKSPLAILVNAGTLGAAGALAEELRSSHAGLIFGSADGPAQTNAAANAPVQPDIMVAASLADERSFMANPYAALASANTNTPAATNNLLPLVDHTSEADLVRAKVKDGEEPEPVPAALAVAPPKPVIRDAALARAVDLIKGLAIVRASHP